MTNQQSTFTAAGHPATCPWCGRERIRGILPSPDGSRWYRCVDCATSFSIRAASPAEPLKADVAERRA